MATTKPTFAKMGLKINSNVNSVILDNGMEIEVKQYLPILDKLVLISNVINNAADENNFMNPVKNELFGSLEIVLWYTNISFTDKQKEDPCKMYDVLKSSGILDKIINAIPKDEYDFVINGISQCSEAIYTYKNSTLGFLNSLQEEYNNLDQDANVIQSKLANPENLALLKEILTKLG